MKEIFCTDKHMFNRLTSYAPTFRSQFNMHTLRKIVTVALFAVALTTAPSEAQRPRGRYVWKRVDASHQSSLSMGLHVPR